jgi:VWFA-related protein
MVASTSAQQQPRAVFRSGSEYVEIDVVVTDKNDQTLTTLTPEDFEVTEGGRPQTIADMQVVMIPTSAARPLVDSRTPSPVVDVMTNTHPPLGRMFGLVIDDLHIQPRYLASTRRVIMEFLRALSGDDQVAVVFTGRSDLSQDFTMDLTAEMQAVNHLEDALASSQDPTAGVAGGGRATRVRQALGSLNVLKGICAALARAPNPRRAIVYVSEGFNDDAGATRPPDALPHVGSSGATDRSQRPPGSDATRAADTPAVSPRTNQPPPVDDSQVVARELQSTYGIARRSGVPIYTIDPGSDALPDDLIRATSDGPIDRPAEGTRLAQHNVLRSVAEHTGGLSASTSLDVSNAVSRIVEDNSSFYLLGYYPDPLVRDGKWHAVEVKVRNRPDLRVRARSGYLAPAATANAAAVEETLDAQLRGALPVSDIALQGFAAPVAASPKGMKAAVAVEVTYPVPDGVTHVDDTIDLRTLVVDREGRVLNSSTRQFHFTVSPGANTELLYLVDDVIDVPAEPVTLRVGVASHLLGKAGTIHLPMSAPSLTDDALHMGGIVLGFAGNRRQPSLGSDAISSIVPFQPTTRRTFTNTTTLQLFTPVFWGTTETSAEITLTIRGDEMVVTHTTKAKTSADDRGRHLAVYLATLPMSDLPLGDYIVEVDATLPNGQHEKREVGFSVR